MTEKFDPAAHRPGPSHYFEDLTIGQKFYIPSRTIGESHFLAFQAVSGDNHPIHYDLEYCRARGMPNLLAHGFQILALTCGGASQFPHFLGDSLVAFIEQSSSFHKPLYAGDTVYPMLEITELVPQRTTGVVVKRSTVHNQRGELLMAGIQKVLVRKRHPLPKA
jgi:acyl dehydratase